MRFVLDADSQRRIRQAAIRSREVIAIVSLIAMPFLLGYLACSNEILANRSSKAPVQNAKKDRIEAH